MTQRTNNEPEAFKLLLKEWYFVMTHQNLGFVAFLEGAVASPPHCNPSTGVCAWAGKEN